jgi:hypothetical protein
MATYTRQLAPVGTTGNNTHQINTNEAQDADRKVLQILVEAVGGTPTATFTWEGSIDGTNWVPISYVTAASSTESQAALVLTAAGLTLLWLAGPSRFFRFFRVRVTANTNVTYSIYTAWQERAE